MIRASDFIPDALEAVDRSALHRAYLAQDRRAFKTGQQLTDELKSILGWKTVIFGMNAFRLPGWASAAVSLLGWSCHFTDFLLYPLVGNEQERTQLTKLGGLANLIANVYDHLLDHHPRRSLAFGPDTLNALMQSKDPLTEIDRPKKSAERLLTGLVAVYLTWLNEYLPGTSNAQLRGFILKTIRRMYEEENRMLHPGPSSPDVLRRSLMIRDVFPFLVMGAPAWMHEDAEDRRRQHFFMLYAVGRTIGLLDDAVDMTQDHARSKENLWLLSEKNLHDKLQYERFIQQRVTHEIQRTMNLWSSLLPTGNTSQARQKIDTFRHTLYSWATLDAVRLNHRL